MHRRLHRTLRSGPASGADSRCEPRADMRLDTARWREFHSQGDSIVGMAGRSDARIRPLGSSWDGTSSACRKSSSNRLPEQPWHRLTTRLQWSAAASSGTCGISDVDSSGWVTQTWCEHHNRWCDGADRDCAGRAGRSTTSPALSSKAGPWPAQGAAVVPRARCPPVEPTGSRASNGTASGRVPARPNPR